MRPKLRGFDGMMRRTGLGVGIGQALLVGVGRPVGAGLRGMGGAARAELSARRNAPAAPFRGAPGTLKCRVRVAEFGTGMRAPTWSGSRIPRSGFRMLT